MRLLEVDGMGCVELPLVLFPSPLLLLIVSLSPALGFGRLLLPLRLLLPGLGGSRLLMTLCKRMTGLKQVGGEG